MDVKPFKDEDGTRKEQVREMFNRIALRYDFLNHLLSFNIDKRWRKRVLRLVEADLSASEDKKSPVRILDIATGTGDLAFVLSGIRDSMITGLDLSEEMIKVAKTKNQKKNAEIEFLVGDSESMPFQVGHFDYITVAFGVRNFENLQTGLKEMNRVLKPGGRVIILEFSKPSSALLSILYGFYSRKILPRIASIFTNEPRAYTYLPESISAFPEGDGMIAEMKKAGFHDPVYFRLSGGISTIYFAASD